MKQDFITAVQEQNLPKIRISLTNELLLDPRGKTFSEMLEYAIENVPSLFEENKEADYSVPPQEEWDKDFLYKVKNDLDSNFSREKLAFYEAVIKYVGKDKAERIQEKESNQRFIGDSGNNGNKKSTNPNHYSIPLSKKTAITTVSVIAAGGAALAIIGLIGGKTWLTVAGSFITGAAGGAFGAAALIVGGIVLYNDKQK